MRLSPGRCEELLRRSDRATLGTVHPVRGVDAVPACFVHDRGSIAIPIDRVKPKSSGVLQREHNLDADRRAVLLCDHWDRHDWSRLWWVRASLERITGSSELQADLEAGLRTKYPQYAGTSFAGLLVFAVTALVGWAADPSTEYPGSEDPAATGEPGRAGSGP